MFLSQPFVLLAALSSLSVPWSPW